CRRHTLDSPRHRWHGLDGREQAVDRQRPVGDRPAQPGGVCEELRGVIGDRILNDSSPGHNRDHSFYFRRLLLSSTRDLGKDWLHRIASYPGSRCWFLHTYQQANNGSPCSDLEPILWCRVAPPWNGAPPISAGIPALRICGHTVWRASLAGTVCLEFVLVGA